MQERRRFVRIPENLQISYEIMPSVKSGAFITKNISQGGIRFFVHDLIPKNSLLKIKLTIKNIPFSFDAMVKLIWIREEPQSERYEIGVEFVNLPKKSAKTLIAYIKDILEVSHRA
ncbi:MAG: hypothetical protein A2166_03810 [Omnitrophica WOR_2 bacterium RBG_13_41_10]|nr:MAG: hypothetical protein A2166_03810 [Omnitrophica WOR_2 bacterium RBG_13_41_10]